MLVFYVIAFYVQEYFYICNSKDAPALFLISLKGFFLESLMERVHNKSDCGCIIYECFSIKQSRLVVYSLALGILFIFNVSNIYYYFIFYKNIKYIELDMIFKHNIVYFGEGGGLAGGRNLMYIFAQSSENCISAMVKVF